MIDFQGLKCWYCGDPAVNRDHIVPRKWPVGKRKRKKARAAAFQQFGRNTLPACEPCNALKGMTTPEEFKADILRCAQRKQYHITREMRLHHLAMRLEPFQFSFYGERGTVNATFPPDPQLAKTFRYRWKQKAARNTGTVAERIEECAKRGEFAEVQGGLMNGR